MKLYEHQKIGVEFLTKRPAALLADSMGLGKTRQALVAAHELLATNKIDRVIVCAPAAVRISWREELNKLESAGENGMYFIECIYQPKTQKIYVTSEQCKGNPLPVLIVSYALLPQKRHVAALSKWCQGGKALLVCDESSFLKSRTAKQTKGSAVIARAAKYCWLLTGTPIANSPLDLYGQALVMSNGEGPLKQFANFYHFRARYAQLVTQHMGRKSFQTVVGYQHLDELTEKFAPYVLRRTKEECLDLPPKTYVTREVALTEATWRVYQELRKDALLALPDAEVKPEPNAAVRILRLCQLTSGHVGMQDTQGTDPRSDDFPVTSGDEQIYQNRFAKIEDVSSEKLSWLVEQLLDGELSSQQAVIIWCRWRRERERLQQLLATKLEVYGVYGGQQPKNRSENVQSFQASQKRRVLVAQPHAGGYGLNLTAASTAVFLSNDFSFTTREQASDRIHRIGQNSPCLYVDVLACGPKGQRTVDHHVLECLKAKRDISEITCAAWRKVLE